MTDYTAYLKLLSNLEVLKTSIHVDVPKFITQETGLESGYGMVDYLGSCAFRFSFFQNLLALTG